MKSVRSTLLVLLPLLCGCAQLDFALGRQDQQHHARSMAEAAQYLAASHQPQLHDPLYADGWNAGYVAALRGEGGTQPSGSVRPHTSDPVRSLAQAGPEPRWRHGYRAGIESASTTAWVEPGPKVGGIAASAPISRLERPVASQHVDPRFAGQWDAHTNAASSTVAGYRASAGELPDALPPVVNTTVSTGGRHTDGPAGEANAAFHAAYSQLYEAQARMRARSTPTQQR